MLLCQCIRMKWNEKKNKHTNTIYIVSTCQVRMLVFFSGPWALSGYVHVVFSIDSLNRTIAFLFMCSKCFTFADRSILQNIVWCWWWWRLCCCCCDCGCFKCHSLWRKLAVRLCLFSVSWWMILIMLQMFDPCSF